MRDKILKVVICLVLIIGCLLYVSELYSRGMDVRCRKYITSCTEDGDKPYVVSISRATSNLLPAGSYCWLVTLYQDGDTNLYWVVYSGGTFEKQTVTSY